MATAPVRVLLVEDDEDDAVLARQYLREIDPAAFDVNWLSAFDAALEQLRHGRYDVALVDYHLGLQNGVDFIRHAITDGCTVPIILLTGQGDHDVDIAAMNAGAADFLSKGQLTPALLERSIRYSIQQRRAEEQRIGLLREHAAREQAEAANRAKDQFLAVLSHELRTPLTAVLLSLNALELETENHPKIAELVTVIRRNADLEARLIDDLLDLTRIARGKLEIRREFVDINEQIDSAVKTCCGSDISAKNLQVSINLSAEKHHVWGDPARIQQVLWNLVKNAAKFTPAGGKIEVRTVNENSRIRISVSDTGIGIAPDAIAKIFNAFEQVDRAITRQFGGLGLGLAICKAIVELHSGKIWAASEGPGQGATFTVELPVVPVDLKPLGTGDPPETLAAIHRGITLLLVEDHYDTASAMSRLLTRRGYSVKVAGSMSDALRLAAMTKFDLLISDIGLPDGTGLELMRRIHAEFPAIKGIALSGFGMEEDIARSRAAGFAEHLTKPIDFKQLEGVLAQLTGRSASANTPTAATSPV